MRLLNTGTHRYTIVQAGDEPGNGGACHEYFILRAPEISETEYPLQQVAGEFGAVRFQKGPIQEAGVNGCHNEDLLAIVIDRLRGFQSGPFRCRENALALTKLEDALHWLNHRTQERQKRGVEGTDTV